MINQKIITNSRIPILLLLIFIAAYSLYFSWYTINRHNTLNSYAADLSLIDQPMWNTVAGPGGFMELTWGDQQQPRLAEHFEPILIPLAVLFFFWDDVRILLITQTLALALGALPVFWIARHQLTAAMQQKRASSAQTEQPSKNIPSLQNDNAKSPISQSPNLLISSWSALAFSLTYLLFPQLQAANIADVHADPFVVTPLLFAFWYGTKKRWGWLWFWAILAMASKETLPTLTAMLGLYLIFDHYQTNKNSPKLKPQSQTSQLPSLPISQSPFLHPFLLILVSTAWFLIATFLIVSPLAQIHFGTSGPIYFENRYDEGLIGFWSLLQDPARWRYIAGLLMAVGFLPLLAPELLILGLPVLAANLLSNFPGQYSGEQHYSAPLVAAFIIAAIYGTGRIINNSSLREVNGQQMKTSVLIGATLWLLSWVFAYHALHGWTPLSIRTETYSLDAAAQQLPSLLSKIPAEAVISASPGIHPHLAHRRVAYVFPTIEEAEFLLVDITDVSGVHPNDVHHILSQKLSQGWQLLAAQHGLLLAHKSAGPVSDPDEPLPASFYNFARTQRRPDHQLKLIFGADQLHMLGYDVKDDPDDGVTFRFYWQTTDHLPADLRLWPLIYDDNGHHLSDPTQVPMIATVWYPPSDWEMGEVVVTETLPQLLPDVFHLGLAAGPNDSFADPTRRYSIRQLDTSSRTVTSRIEPMSYERTQQQPGNWVQLATFQRQGPFLQRLPPTATLRQLSPKNIQFGSKIHLTGYRLDPAGVKPGEQLPILLRWQTTAPPATDYTVFIHLVNTNGNPIAQSDAYPTWLTPMPTSQWQPHRAYMDRHTLALPADLPAGQYLLQVGLYQAETLERLPLVDGRDALPLEQINIR